MLHQKLTLISLCLFVFSFFLSQTGIAQGMYDLQFTNVVVDCDAETLCFDIELKASAPGTEFLVSDINIRFSFSRGLDNPVIVQELDISGSVPGPGPMGSSLFSTHNLSGSLDTIVSYNVEMIIGDGVFIGATDWVGIGSMCLDILDFDMPAELVFHTEAIFPPTFVGMVNADGSLGEADEGTYTNYTQDLTTVCACAALDLNFNFDANAQQTSWEILDATGVAVASGGAYNMGDVSAIESVCLPDGCYDLVVSDSANDGMCPRRTSTVLTGINVASLGLGGVSNGIPRVGQMCGDYTLTDANGNTIASGGGRFGGSETNSFCIVGGVPQLFVNDDANYARQVAETDLSEMTLAPNPVHNQLNISCKVSTNAEIQLSILDITGKIIRQDILEAADFSNVQLDVSELGAGFYVVQLRSKNVLISDKFVKR